MFPYPLIKGLLSVLFIQVLAHGISAAAGNTLQEIVNAGLAAGDKVIRIPPGRYELAPADGTHLLLKGVRDVTIDATGVEMICTETTLAVYIKDCANLRIEGLTIDYDPLPFTQGRIVEISEDRKSHTIEIMEGFPPAETAYVFKHSIYTTEGELRFGSYYQYQLEALSDGRLKVFGLEQRKDGGEQLGDIVIVSTQHLTGRYRPHAIVVENSRNTVLEGVRLYSSPCFGFFELDSSGSVYRNCIVDRREGRVHSLNADAFHSKHAEVGPQILNCKAMWQGDDCVNICGDYYLVTGREEDWLRVLIPGRMRMREGDPVQLVSADGERLADAVAISIRRIGELTGADEELVAALPLNRKVQVAIRSVYKVRLDRPVKLEPGAVIASNNRMGNGFTIKDCLFGNNRSRGILVKASDGEISGNEIVNTRMQSIKIAPEYHWLESGFSRNLRIARNRITSPGMEAVLVRGVGPFHGHEDLHVLDNVIRTGKSPALRIQSVAGGRVDGNEIVDMAGTPLVEAIELEFCDGLHVSTSTYSIPAGR